ncbi:hypothetical protein EU523_01590, partial [Candidatus Heimdallarchaeota archaeon]
AWFRELGIINDFLTKQGYQRWTLFPIVAKNRLCPLVKQHDRDQFAQIGCWLFDCQLPSYLKKMSRKTLRNINVEFEAFLRNRIKTGVDLSEILWEITSYTSEIKCPYLLIQNALSSARLVIATYPYLINPILRDILFTSMDILPSQTTIIIDEAHNIASGQIGHLSFKKVQNAVQEIDIDPILNDLLSMKGEKQLITYEPQEEDLIALRKKAKRHVKNQYEQGRKVVSSALEIYRFLQQSSNSYIAVNGNFKMYLQDPRELLSVIDDCKQRILLSGTFRPLDYFANFLGVPNAKKINLTSYHRRKNRIILTTVDPKLTLRYSARTKQRFLYYGEVLSEIIVNIPGNVLIFTPNYEITAILANLLRTSLYEKPQQNVASLIQAVQTSLEKVILIAPARGKVSEGIEFVRDEQSLIKAVIIAGLPYPPPTRSLKQLAKKYAEIWGEEQAANYLFFLPAEVAIRQCLGRMLRSKKDIGAWIILDNRVVNLDLFNHSISCRNTSKIIYHLQTFYQKHH